LALNTMETETKKRPARKVAILLIFIALLVVLAWLSVTIVRSVPGSFASLASLAESVRTFDTTNLKGTGGDEATNNQPLEELLIVTSDTNVIATNGEVRLTWTDTTAVGSFVFSYECTEGVALAIVESNGVREVDCATNYNIGDRTNVVLSVSSERERFVDVPYSIGFVTDDESGPVASDDAVITIVNEAIPLTFNDEVAESETPSVETTTALETETEPEVESPAPEPEMVSNPEPKPVTTTTEPETPEAPFTQEYTYTIPVSDPNGTVDLATRFIGSGSISNNTFVAGDPAPNNPLAVQFEVKNLGSKTSGAWSYQANLPTGGLVDSDAQAPLRPNERALITIGFPASATASTVEFEVEIETTEDTTTLNNQFVQTVTF
jgi:hypothetical protein